MLALLLVRQGVDVLVLEKHGDFLRDFRGDTIHPSTIRIMDEIGLSERFLARPHDRLDAIEVDTAGGRATLAEFRRLHTPWPYIAMMPQWEFLDFVTDEARRYPGFELLMEAEATDLVEDGDGIVRGLRYRTAGGVGTVQADLVVAADGRRSVLRDRAGLVPTATSPPMDVLWFRLPRRDGDPETAFGQAGPGRLAIFIRRSDYWQAGYIIAKGSADQIRAAGLPEFRRSLARIAPWAADRVDTLTSWDKVSLLVVESNRLRRWWRPGFLAIGDAAHAMSPVGGVGINLAIQDAVVAANVLAKPLAERAVRPRHLASVQRRRVLPTRAVQAFQAAIQRGAIARTLDSTTAPQAPPAALGLLRKVPVLRDVPARLVGLGVWPVHVRDRDARVEPAPSPTPSPGPEVPPPAVDTSLDLLDKIAHPPHPGRGTQTG
jgi:2-polyprenyl-6-methoxyphenol hydroxylase-like FAD-dependent oxidoreductase